MPLLHNVSPRATAVSLVPKSHLPLGFDVVSIGLALSDPACIVILGAACGIAGDAANFGHEVDVSSHFGFGFAVAALFSTAAHAHGLYLKSRLQQLGPQIKRAVLIWVMVFLCLAAVMTFLRVGNTPSRATILLLFTAGLSTIVALRWGTLRVVAHLSRSQARPKRQVVVVAPTGQPVSVKVWQAITASGGSVCKTISLPKALDDPGFPECMRELIDFVRWHAVEEILLAINWTDQAVIAAVSKHLRVLPCAVKLISDPVISAFLERPLLQLGDARAIELQRAPLTQPQRAMKRLFDVSMASCALLVLLPVLIAVAVLIRLNSPGQILFRQRRIGFNGRPFYIYKFRTMRTVEDGPIILQACRGNSRITRVGQLLRKYSIDELPQLLNVLKDEMSLVGPRPHALAHDSEYGRVIALYAARHNVKPGITGWAQVNGWRGATPQLEMMIQRVEHDLWYINSWSHWLDIKILFLTVFGSRTSRNAF